MPLVRRIRRRGANIVVEANGEVLFAASGDVGRWTNRFSNRTTAFTRAAAPENKRPRWAHYGKPLRGTITSSTTYQPGRMKVYSAVGSSAPHAYYVDQGTGIYAGNGPYEAKVLPPWEHQSPSLYEATWRPGGPGTRKVGKVMIKGQRAQHFFDAGLKRAFTSMRMRSYQVPGDPKITNALDSIPTGLANFLGNTPAGAGFRASLTEWRAWRDAAWGERKELGRGVATTRTKNAAKKAAAAKPRSRPKHTKPKPAPIKKPKAGFETVAQKKAAALAQFHRQNPHVKIIRSVPSGIIVQTPHGPHLVPWSALYNLI